MILWMTQRLKIFLFIFMYFELNIILQVGNCRLATPIPLSLSGLEKKEKKDRTLECAGSHQKSYSAPSEYLNRSFRT